MNPNFTPETLANLIAPMLDGEHSALDIATAVLPELLAPTDAKILSSLRHLYASDESAAMAAEDDIRTVRAYLAAQTASIDVEAMLKSCVPGGNIVDPQAVADNIRNWFAEHGLASRAGGQEPVAFDEWHDRKWPEPEHYEDRVRWRSQKKTRRHVWDAARAAPAAGEAADELANAVRVLLELPQLRAAYAYNASSIIDRVHAALAARPQPASQGVGLGKLRELRDKFLSWSDSCSSSDEAWDAYELDAEELGELLDNHQQKESGNV